MSRSFEHQWNLGETGDRKEQRRSAALIYYDRLYITHVWTWISDHSFRENSLHYSSPIHLDTLMFCSAKGDIHLGFSTSPKDAPTWDCSQDDACVDVTLCSESLGFLQQPSWMYLSIALGIGSLQALSWPCHVDRVDVFFFLDWEGLACPVQHWTMCHAWHCIFVALFGRCNSVMFCIVLSKRCWSYFLGAGTRYFIAFNIRPLLGLMGYVEALVVPKFLCFFLNKIHVDDLAETCSCKGTDVLFIQARRGILGRKKSAMWLVSHGGNKIYIPS